MTIAIEDLLFAAPMVTIDAAGGIPPQVVMIAYTGGLMTVPGWGPVVIDLAGLNLGERQIGILADHDSTLKGIVGYGFPMVVNHKLMMHGSISTSTDTGQRIIELAKSGFPFQASVGVAPDKVLRLRESENVQVNGRLVKAPHGGLTLVRSSTLREVSIVAIGADSQTSVTISASQGEENMQTVEEAKTMTADEIRAEALAETHRVLAIRKACSGRFADIEAQAIQDGWDAKQTELAVLRASRPSVSLHYGGHAVTTPEALEAGILHFMGRESLAEKHLGAEAAERGRALRATSIHDLCRAALTIEGVSLPSGRDALIRAGFSTNTLPIALGNAANKILMNAYVDSPATWRAFAAIKSANDFKDHTGVRPSLFTELDKVAKGGEVKYGSLTESTYPFSIDTFGRNLGIDRRDIVNDDLGLFDDAAQALGRSAMRSLSDLVYKTLLDNAGSYFSVSNGNFVSGGTTGLSVSSLQAAVAAMIARRDAENRDLDIRPRTLVVPPELAQLAKEILFSDFIQRANDTPTGNALKGVVGLEVEPRLSNPRFSGASTKAWYLFGSVLDSAMVVAFLQGRQTPVVEFFGFDSNPNVLAATWRVYFDYGSALADFRAAYKSKGEA